MLLATCIFEQLLQEISLYKYHDFLNFNDWCKVVNSWLKCQMKESPTCACFH